jgi:cell division protein FtsN
MAKHKSSGGSTLYGILAGLLIGLMVAAAVAYYVVKAPSPFVDKASRSPDASKPVDPRTAPDPNAGLGGRNAVEGTPVDPNAAAYGAGGQVAAPLKSAAPDDLGALIATLKPTGTPAAMPPAETLRARIILMGLPVEIQRAEVNGVQFNRVRVGPYVRIDDMNKTRARLGEEKLPTTVVRQ